MNSNHFYSNQTLTIPPLKLNHTSSRTPLPIQPEVIIPVFHNRSLQQLSGSKRSNPHFFEQNIMKETIPSKKIKVGSFNMLAKVNFSNMDPYWPEGCDVDSPNKQKPVSPTMKPQELNTKIISQKGLTINISTKKTTEKICTSVNQSQRIPERPYLRNVQSKIPVNFNRLPDMRESLYHLVSQRLEENCFTLFQSMKELLVLRQHFSARNQMTPMFDLGLEETMPGTPCTNLTENMADISPRGNEVENSQAGSVGKSVWSTPAVSRQVSTGEVVDSEADKILLPTTEVKEEK